MHQLHVIFIQNNPKPTSWKKVLAQSHRKAALCKRNEAQGKDRKRVGNVTAEIAGTLSLL